MFNHFLTCIGCVIIGAMFGLLVGAIIAASRTEDYYENENEENENKEDDLEYK